MLRVIGLGSVCARCCRNSSLGLPSPSSPCTRSPASRGWRPSVHSLQGQRLDLDSTSVWWTRPEQRYVGQESGVASTPTRTGWPHEGVGVAEGRRVSRAEGGTWPTSGEGRVPEARPLQEVPRAVGISSAPQRSGPTGRGGPRPLSWGCGASASCSPCCLALRRLRHCLFMTRLPVQIHLEGETAQVTLTGVFRSPDTRNLQ